MVKTRIVWEQDVIPRLKPDKADAAYKVLAELLDLEDFHASSIGVSGVELTDRTARYISFAPAFVNNLPATPKNFYREGHEMHDQRRDRLKLLANALQQMGLVVPNLGGPGEFTALEC